MARDGVAVDANLAAAVAAYVATPHKHNVAALCRDLDVSRQTFYKYVRRFDAAGVEGFYPDSRRPEAARTGFPPVSRTWSSGSASTRLTAAGTTAPTRC